MNTGNKISQEINNEIKPDLKLNISLKLRQSLKILQMNCIELNQYIRQQCQDNPVIEIEHDNEWEISEKVYDKILRTENPGYMHGKSIDDEQDDYISPLLFYSIQDPMEYILNQLRFLHLDSNDYEIAKYIAFSLDKNGYFTDNILETATRLHTTEDHIVKIVNIIKTLDPCGIGASSLKECLLLQIERLNIDTQYIKDIIDNYFDELCCNKCKFIASSMNVSINEVEHCLKIIKKLNPKPGGFLRQETFIHYIIPDIIIEKKHENYHIKLNNTFYPKINYNGSYLDILKNRETDIDTKKYISEHVIKAQNLESFINNRKETLEKVAETILELQSDFFNLGRLVPMNLEDVAKKLNLHISTVSRAISDKYLQCPQGMFSLKYFFSQALKAGDTGLTSLDIKNMISHMVNSENKYSPLSDSQIVKNLEKLNMNVSRRTVAKYRHELCMPNSNMRKQF